MKKNVFVLLTQQNLGINTAYLFSVTSFFNILNSVCYIPILFPEKTKLSA